MTTLLKLEFLFSAEPHFKVARGHEKREAAIQPLTRLFSGARSV